MTNALVPGANIILELDTLAAIIAAAAYGIVLTLYIFTVLALVKSGDKYTTQKRIILLAYITLSLLLSTTAYVSSMLYIVETVFDVQLLNGRVRLRDAAWIYPLSILVTDAFMILRCVALYRGLSKKLRIFLMCVCGLMFILVGGLEWFKFILPKKFTQAEGILGFAFLSASLFANITLSALISFRIIQLQRNNHEVLRVAQGSVYTRIVIMCIESCAMIVVFEVAYIVIYNIPPSQGANHGSLIPLLLIPHICAISSYLIICRVAQGLDVATQIDLSPDFPQTANRETSHPSTGLQFALSAHTQSDEDV